MRYALTNGAILDGTLSMRPLRGKTVIVDNGKIEQIVDCDRANLNGCRIVDMRNGFLMPGLINLCVHLSGDGNQVKKNVKDSKDRIKKITSNPILTYIEQNKYASRAKTELMSGVTTICTENGIPGWDSTLRDKIEAGKFLGPRILVSSKVSVPEETAATAPAIQEVKGKKNHYVSSLSALLPFAKFAPGVTGLEENEKAKSNEIFEKSVKQIRDCMENRGHLGLATGAGNEFVPHYNFWTELFFLHKYCGVSNLECLHKATEVNARIAGIGDIAGRIAEGMDADLIVTDTNPLENLNALSNVFIIMTRGRLISKPVFRFYPDVDKELSLYLMD